jgi:hypothetical protein
VGLPRPKHLRRAWAEERGCIERLPIIAQGRWVIDEYLEIVEVSRGAAVPGPVPAGDQRFDTIGPVVNGSMYVRTFGPCADSSCYQLERWST